MLLLNSPEAANNYVTVGTVISASGAIIGILIAVLRDLFKRQNETLDKKFDEINERIDRLTNSHDTERDHRHQLEVRVAKVEATLQANGCMTPGPSCDRTK